MILLYFFLCSVESVCSTVNPVFVISSEPSQWSALNHLLIQGAVLEEVPFGFGVRRVRLFEEIGTW